MRNYVYVTVKGWQFYSGLFLEKEFNLEEYKEYVKKNTGAKRIHIEVKHYEIS